MAPNPLRSDPTRTQTLRRQFETEVRKRLKLLKRAIYKLIVEEDAFGLAVKPLLATNTRWQFITDEAKLEAFKAWLLLKLQEGLLEARQPTGDVWTAIWIRKAYERGLGRAFDEVRKPGLAAQSNFYQGTKAEFLRSSFQRPASVERIKLLAARTFTDLDGISKDIETKLSRVLVDGFINGDNPRTIARQIDSEIDTIGRKRALTLARTEVIRAHAEGAIDGMEALGVEEIGVAVEWSTAEDSIVCPLCRPLDGIILSIEEAHGMFPRHPNCRCSPIPANVGEADRKQTKKTKARIKTAIDKSIAAEIPKKSKRSVATQRSRSSWVGAGKAIRKQRPKSIL